MGFLQRFHASLTFVAIDIEPALAVASANDEPRSRVLGKLAGFGTLHRSSLDVDSRAATLQPWQSSVLQAAGAAGREAEFPSAPLVRSGETQQLTSEAWAHLECVHFAAGLNDVAGVRLQGAARLDPADRDELAATLGEHVRADGFELHAAAQGDWLLRLPRALDLRTVAPEAAFRSGLASALPSGADAAQLRRLMTELQMLLHEHPVNLRRVRAGLPAANAVWIWGAGALTDLQPRADNMPIAFGTQPFLKGFYLLHGTAVRAEPFSLDLLRERRNEHTLVVAEVSDLDTLESQWLAPFAKALRRGWIEELHVHLGTWRIDVRRRDLLRFWRHAHAPDRWSA